MTPDSSLLDPARAARIATAFKADINAGALAGADQLRFILREGRKRQIRRMCELVGLQVLGLKRVRIGTVTLGDLPQGKWLLLGAGEGFA